LGGVSVIIRDHDAATDYVAPIFSIRPFSSCWHADKSNDACLTLAITAQVPWEVPASKGAPPYATTARRAGKIGFIFPDTFSSDNESFSLIVRQDGVESADFLFNPLYDN